MIDLISHRDFEGCNVDAEMKLSTTVCSVTVCFESRVVLIQVLELDERDRKCIKSFSKFFTLGIRTVSFFFTNVLAMLRAGQYPVEKRRAGFEKCL